MTTTSTKSTSDGTGSLVISTADGIFKLTCTVMNSLTVGFSNTANLGVQTIYILGPSISFATFGINTVLRASLHGEYTWAKEVDKTQAKATVVKVWNRFYMKRIQALGQESQNILDSTEATYNRTETVLKRSEFNAHAQDIENRTNILCGQLEEASQSCNTVQEEATRVAASLDEINESVTSCLGACTSRTQTLVASSRSDTIVGTQATDTGQTRIVVASLCSL